MAVIAVTAIMTGCATPKPPAGDALNSTSMAVAVVAGQQWEWRRSIAGSLGIGGFAKPFNAPMDTRKMVEDRVMASLSPRFSPRVASGLKFAALVGLTQDEIGNRLRVWATANRITVDTILVVVDGRLDFMQVNANAPGRLKGTGVFGHWSTPLGNTVGSYVLMDFILYNAKTFTPITSFSLAAPPVDASSSKTDENAQGAWPRILLKDPYHPDTTDVLSQWKDSYYEYGPTERQIIDASMRAIIEKSVPFTLAREKMM